MNPESSTSQNKNFSNFCVSKRFTFFPVINWNELNISYNFLTYESNSKRNPTNLKLEKSLWFICEEK